MIVLWADSRWRDSFGLALLSNELDKIGVPNIVASFDLAQQITDSLGSHVSGMVLNHTIGGRNRELVKRTRRFGGSIFVLPTEGKPTPENEKWFFDNQEDYDLLFSWTDKFAPPRTEVTGSPRFQIYTHYKQHIEDKEYVLDKYGLPEDEHISVFVSAFPQAKFLYKSTKFLIDDWKDLKRDGAVDNAILSMRELSDFQSAIRDGYGTVVIRPHPMEDLGWWEKFQYQLKLETGLSSHLISQEYIYNLLQVANTWTNKPFCTTILDRRLHKMFVEEEEVDEHDWASDVVVDIDSAKEIAILIKKNTNLKSVPRDVYLKTVNILKIHNGQAFMPSAGGMHTGKSVPLSVISGWKGKIANG